VACWLWLGAGATTLQTATPSAFNYRVLCCCTHTCLIDPTINHALWIVIGCLHPTPADNPPILAGIQPAELHCNGATLSLACRVMEARHLLQSAHTRPLRCTVPYTLPHNILSVHLKTCVRQTGQITNGMQSVRTTPQDSFSSLTPAPIAPERPSQEEPVSGSTLWRPAAFEDFQKKTLKHMWFGTGIYPVW